MSEASNGGELTVLERRHFTNPSREVTIASDTFTSYVAVTVCQDRSTEIRQLRGSKSGTPIRNEPLAILGFDDL